LANSIDKVKVQGKALYTCMLDEKGGVIDDLIVYFLGEEFFRLVVNASTREKDLAWIGRHAAAFDVDVRAREDLAIIAVQGPGARERVIGRVAAADRDTRDTLGRFASADARREAGAELFVARTGSPGEAGFGIVLPAGDAPA